MSPFQLFICCLFAAVIANDYVLAKKIRKAVDLQRLNCPDLEHFRFGGSPLGIGLNLFRLRKIPTPNEFSDPDLIAIRLHYRAQQILVTTFAVCLVVALLASNAAR